MNIKDQFCNALLPKASQYIKFPQTEQETRRAIEAFEEISTFPQIVGAIDGSHIEICAPREHPNDC